MSTKKELELINPSDFESLFKDLKSELTALDPVAFAENYLTIDGNPFNLSSSGWKFMSEMYRTIALQVDNKQARPIVITKGRQVGATVMAGALSLYLTSSGIYGTKAGNSPIRVLHAFPALKLMNAYAKDKLSVFLANSQNGYVASRSARMDPDVKASMIPEDSNTEKTFIGFSKLKIDSTGRTGDRIRGLSQDVVFFDEVQDMSRTAIENTTKILRTSPYGASGSGVQLYFGTPKQRGSYFWNLWDNSDQRFYHLGCEKCGEHFQLYNLEDDSWTETWVEKQVVKCPVCGHHQDKREAVDRGKWIPSKPDASSIGYHFNMMLMPLFEKEVVLKEFPGHNEKVTERAWKNETLGDFYSGGGYPLTMQDIYENALDDTRGVSKAILDKQNKTIVMGIDWGDKSDDDEEGGGRGQSFTTVVILSVDHSGTMMIETAIKLKNNLFEAKVHAIQKLMEDFKVTHVVADYMWGQDVVRHFQEPLGHGNNFLGCYNSGSLNKDLSFDPKLYKVVMNKNMLIEETFGLIKRGKIKFPVKGNSFDRLYWLMQDCTSMEVKTRVKSENTYKHYVKGNRPNDGLMSLIYAVISYKYIVSNGFRGSADVKKERSTSPIVGYLPNWR